MLHDLTPRILKLLGHVLALEPGPLAELRRPAPAHGAPAFWNLFYRHQLEGDPAAWEVALRAIAILTPTGRATPKPTPHDRATPLGRALHAAGVSNPRFARLLATRAPAHRDALLRLVPLLERAGQGFDICELVWLILSGPDALERNKRGLARDYYATEAAATRNEKEPDNA